ncbi:nuclease A inhibitor family protein [Pedobacter rhodius]|uniref:Nuclease A inhibitor-like protein n=1 Tax=Pedobacter rhodius TaxID=3004098 RepID=A0ABT4L1G4_9SPHI|nr:nuclease A inhibitor family protein [Pedobacter sp. SJ11]MCZ4225012.1 hypothetical protein [Pedobacter sp. SJ11]
MSNNILTTITKLLLGVLYFTESESHFTATDWGKIPPAQLQQKIANQYHVPLSDLKILDHATFFNHVISKVDASDAPMLANAQKIAELYSFLKQNLSGIQVIRVEGKTKIPVLIVGYLPDSTCIAIETFAIET